MQRSEGSLEFFLRADEYDEGAGHVAPANAGRTEDALTIGDGGLELAVGDPLSGDTASL